MGWGGVALAINGYPGVKQDYGTKAQDRMHDIATVVWVWAFVYCAAFSLLLLYRIVSQPKAFLATMHKPGDTDTEWRFFKIIGRILAAILTLTACYIHALTIKHAVTPKFWHGFHPKQT